MTLVHRRAAQAVCALGLIQLLFATALVVCGFIALGLFRNVSCIGIWLGFPMMIPGLCSIVLLATRKRFWSVAVIVTSVIILAVSLYHIYAVNEEAIEYWGKYRKMVESHTAVCYDRGDRCSCAGSESEYNAAGYYVQFCSLYRVGEDLFWTMMAFTIAGALFSLINIFVALWATFSKAPKQISA